MAKTKVEKLETAAENWKDKYDELKKSNVLKIIFAIIGTGVAFLSSYLQFEMSGVELEKYKFTGNAMHVIGILLILLPWLKMPFKIKAN